MLLEVRALSVHYGTIQALESVSFGLTTGEIVALIGPNGAGKSTALKALSGAAALEGGRITAGEVWFDGSEITGTTTDRLVRAGISLIPERRHVFSSMSVAENLEMGGYTLKRRDVVKSTERVLTIFPHLQCRLKVVAGVLSTGEQQMVALARGLMINPRLLLADEPFLGLSPEYVDIVSETLRDINRSGTSVLFAEQNVSMALDLAHRAYVFERGRIPLAGNSGELQNSAEVKRLFWGS